MSDYFGRKDVLMVGQAFLLFGHVVGASAQSVSQVIAAMALLGVGTGTTFV
jgi:dipeptide/tripeptide permease